jgi:NAD(P)H-dependent FMN reductase
MRPRLRILVCSTRPGRVGPRIAEWALEAASAHARFDADLLDIAAFELPVFDEPEHPRLGNYRHAHTRAWSAAVDSADAFLFVMPEYNHGPPPSLLNALNYLVREWQYKALGFVSYGGISGGMRAVQVTKQLVSTYKMVPMLEAVALPNVAQHLGGSRFEPLPVHTESARVMLDELYRWTIALASLRNSQETKVTS